jgi:hypothetical protein
LSVLGGKSVVDILTLPSTLDGVRGPSRLGRKQDIDRGGRTATIKVAH